MTLAITAVRHRSPLVAGIAVTGATLGWTAGAWVQARLSETWQGRRFVRTGLVIVLAGIAGMVLVLRPHVPVAVGLVAWTVAGLGMGLAYAPLSLMMLREAPPGREGRTSASLNLADVLGTALGIGVGGAAVAAGAGRDLPLGITAAFAASAAVGVVALAVSRRLPPAPPRPRRPSRSARRPSCRARSGPSQRPPPEPWPIGIASWDPVVYIAKECIPFSRRWQSGAPTWLPSTTGRTGWASRP